MAVAVDDGRLVVCPGDEHIFISMDEAHGQASSCLVVTVPEALRLASGILWGIAFTAGRQEATRER